MTHDSIRWLAALAVALMLTSACSDSSKDDGGGRDGGGDGDSAGDGGAGDGDTGGNGSGGDGDGDGILSGDGGPIGCGSTPFAADAIPVELMVVVDASGSMDDPTVADPMVTRWQALSSALDAALGGVTAEINMGLQLYPTPDANSDCVVPDDTMIDVPIGDGTTSHPMIVSAMGARAPEGGTPTSEALYRARRYFTEGAGKDLTGDRVVLLATDGGPNCNSSLTCGADTCISNLEKRPNCDVDMGMGNCCDESIHVDLVLSCLDDTRAIAEVEALALTGVRTLVVGIPGSEIFRDVLQSMATAGGGADGYFEVDAAQGVSGLTTLLRDITEGLITSCKLQLESTPPDLDQINVEIDGETIAQAGDDGWELDRSTDPPTVVIKGATCAALEADGAKSVDIIYGCPTVL